MICGGVAQLVERSVRIREVMSSNLTVSTTRQGAWSQFALRAFSFSKIAARALQIAILTGCCKQSESEFARFGFYFFIKSIGQKDFAGKKPHG